MLLVHPPWSLSDDLLPVDEKSRTSSHAEIGMAKAVIFDFYRVQLPSLLKRSFGDLIRQVGTLPDDESRNAKHNDQTIRLHRLDEVSGRIEGELVRIRMDQHPASASLAGGLAPIGLKEDEGVGEETAFLYDPALNIVVLQRNRQGVTAAGFAAYFARINDLGAPIALSPVVQADEVQRVLAMKRYSRLTLAVAGFDKSEFLPPGEDGPDVDAVNRIMKEYEAPNLEITVSLGRSRGSLPPVKMHQAVLRWLRIGKESEQVEVKKLEISGEPGSPDDPETISLFRFYVTETVDIEQDAHRRLAFASRQIALRNVFNHQRAQLERLFRQDGGAIT